MLYNYTTLSQGSDEILKENIEPFSDSVLDVVADINPIKFNYKTNTSSEVLGFSAQNISTAFKSNGLTDCLHHVISERVLDADGNVEEPHTLNLTGITALSFKAIKELLNSY